MWPPSSPLRGRGPLLCRLRATSLVHRCVRPPAARSPLPLPVPTDLLTRDRSRADLSSPLVQSPFGGESGRVQSGHSGRRASPALPAVPQGQVPSSGGLVTGLSNLGPMPRWAACLRHFSGV
ncbi:hypothetical protein NDU88_001538 [Pleurodeles waltl]|uniref:Uncharacterized protein n=1 Tax=Pleurodeles waltl TaxID=8319 RepID=A0AAV7UUB7_PLEWA|nr:hypothetical protein NDU88_001538 [Pleurodeles waltl]